MKVTGACHCGFLAFEAEVDPATAGICHCTDCQVFSGSAFRAGVSGAETDFRLLAGTPKVYMKTAESGARRAQAFCPECGTHIYATSAPAAGGEGTRSFRIRLSTLRERDALPPRHQIWTRSSPAWLAQLASLPRRERQ